MSFFFHCDFSHYLKPSVVLLNTPTWSSCVLKSQEVVCGCPGEEPVWEKPGRIHRNQSDYADWQAEVISNEDGFGEYITFLENSLHQAQ